MRVILIPSFLTLHPIMFLLNPKALLFVFLININFTSHYVPIKSCHCLPMMPICFLFTSHYVPIKSDHGTLYNFKTLFFTSHYVPIKSILSPRSVFCHTSLHPIMFLLNLFHCQIICFCRICFTSHYVPIKSIFVFWEYLRD